MSPAIGHRFVLTWPRIIRMHSKSRAKVCKAGFLKALTSHCLKTIELYPEFFLQQRNRRAIVAPIEFALQLTTDVPDTQVGTVRNF